MDKTSRPYVPAALEALTAARMLLFPGYRWALELGTQMTALTLELLRAQQAALDHLASDPRQPLAPPGARLTIRDIHDRVAAAGFREISEIEWEDGCYEVEARDARGQAFELRVNGSNGAIEDIEAQD
ncbi:MAG TPA: PepSY domain-containing protein [Ottowia sp.]|uniref:PepSY domain-containing protein n=1 Tax=Ottowia sp. TaxID=1898956 RepID=UPI002B7C4766|nr:PepSY domain-containing protein [Ottowia sp.]HMN21148.1 PepSY domain-containing protein [Ottowia sp.]